MKLTVTDHALVRFLERALGFDVEAVRRRIADEVGAPVAGLRTVRRNGYRFQLAEYTDEMRVVTCEPVNGAPSRTRQRSVAMKRTEVSV